MNATDDGESTSETTPSNLTLDDAEPLPRAARYTRNELPLLIIRPVNGVSPSNKKPGSVYITTGPRGMYI